MERRICFCALALALGCGSGEETTRDRILGGWFADLEYPYGILYSFEGDGTFGFTLARVGGGQIDAEVYFGGYQLRDGENGPADDNGSYLFLRPTEGTCPGAWTDGLFVDFSGESLILADQYGVTTLERVMGGDTSGESGGAGSTTTFGCFTDSGFYPSPLQRLDEEGTFCEPGALRACATSATGQCMGIQECDAIGSAYGACYCP